MLWLVAHSKPFRAASRSSNGPLSSTSCQKAQWRAASGLAIEQATASKRTDRLPAHRSNAADKKPWSRGLAKDYRPNVIHRQVCSRLHWATNQYVAKAVRRTTRAALFLNDQSNWPWLGRCAATLGSMAAPAGWRYESQRCKLAATVHLTHNRALDELGRQRVFSWSASIRQGGSLECPRAALRPQSAHALVR